MVFFTCNNCGESVKKPAVEKHYNTRCRNNTINVSCMDCLKDFYGDEYVAHTKCISEAEKYSGKNYVAKENKNSGQKKQETWTDIVRSILESSEYQLSAHIRNIFQRLQNYENVPRKKAKFQNFVSNSLKISANQAQPAWTVLEKELEKMKQAKQQEEAAAKAAIEEAKKAKEDKENGQQNGLKRKNKDHDNEEEKMEKKKRKTQQDEAATGKANGIEAPAVEGKKKKKKQQTEEPAANGIEEPAVEGKKKKKKQETEEPAANVIEEPAVEGKKKKKKQETEEPVINGLKEAAVEANRVKESAEEEGESFQWSTILENVVGKHEEGITLDKLKKKLLKKYISKLKLEELNEKQQKKFEKKFSKTLKKCPAIKVEGELAKLC